MKVPVLSSNNRKREVVEEVESEVLLDYQYVTLLFLSTIIATLSLLVGNSAVIIGAMILSPVIWPVIGIGLATVVSRRKLLIRSVSILIFSITSMIFISYLVALVSPIKEISREISIQINPTFFDLIIALGAGVAGSAVLIWPRFAMNIAGVAVAVSVMPPLCVSGIGLAQGDIKMVYGSMLLFLTNIASIIFASIIVFILHGYFIKTDKKKMQAVEASLVFSFVIIVILSIQLLFSFSEIIYTNRTQERVETFLSSELEKLSEDITIESISINSLSQNIDTIDVEARLRVPSQVKIGIANRDGIVKKLGKDLQKNVNLELTIVEIVKVSVAGGEKESRIDERIQETVERVIHNYLQQVSGDIVVESVIVSKKMEKPVVYFVKTLIRVPENVETREIRKDDIEFLLISRLKNPTELTLEMVRYSQL